VDFDEAITILNDLLEKKRPDTFSPSWIYYNCPRVYRFIWKNIRTDHGIDWDRVTGALKREFQKRWVNRRKTYAKPYRNITEVRKILKTHKNKLYTFVSPADWDDKCVRDVISIALVRIAQNGNIRAREELMKLLTYAVEGWVEQSPRIERWRWYPDELPKQLDRCIRCYRYTGSFMKYLFMTLEYSARGLPPVYSLNECFADSEKSRLDNVVRDPETQEIRMFGR
jgi:hypothetical protein